MGRAWPLDQARSSIEYQGRLGLIAFMHRLGIELELTRFGGHP
jgi:hypothetical protein